MNFFEHQQRARRNTAWLVLLYLLAVLGILIAIDALIWILYSFETDSLALGRVPEAIHLFALVVAAAVILGATVYKVIQLADGGEAVARMVGARQVMPQTGDLAEKRLMNVVEEMAIASGTAVPGVFVMDDEAGINAFAAGYTPNEAVIAVTRGTLAKLNRDELQGVIGHEFSHILNGDMRINVRMMGVLFGITCVGSIGRFLLRATSETRSSSRRGGGGVQAGIFVLGLGLMLIGAVGVFFARIIKAAVSRQREFLADASSVQFTRNPDGLAGALDRISATGAGTLVENRYAEELSHMFFGQSVRMLWAGLMDTHPPIDERIRRVHPGFPRRDYRNRREQEEAAGTPRSIARPEAEGWGAAAAAFDSGAQAARFGVEAQAQVLPAQIVASVGNPSQAHMRYAHGLLESVPPMLRMMAVEPRGAQALVLSLALAKEEEARAQQLAVLEQHGDGGLGSLALAPSILVRKLGPAYVLPLLDLATPALKLLDATTRGKVLAALRCAIEADRKVSLQEFVLLAITERRLAEHAGRAQAPGQRAIADLAAQTRLVLSLLARSGNADEKWVVLAFERAVVSLRLEGSAGPLAWSQVRLDDVREALQSLHALAPAEKARLLEACVLAVTADDFIHLREGELVRLIASELDLPLPPILQQPPAIIDR